MDDIRTPAQKLVQTCLDRYNPRQKGGVGNPFDGYSTATIKQAAEYADAEARAFRANAVANPKPPMGAAMDERLIEMFEEIAEDARTEVEARSRR